MKIKNFRVSDQEEFHLADFSTDRTSGRSKGAKTEAELARNIEELVKLQDVLYAHNKFGVLVILQAMDAAGKDGAIKHIMSGLNPQGVEVTPFKVPSAEELDHDYLWRSHEHLPERGTIAIFNRSYYEEVLVVKVHNLVESQNLPDHVLDKDIWQERYRQLRDFERYMHENGIVVVKIFLHLSKKEHAPWYIVPADRKWFARLLISDILVQTLKKMPLAYPELSEEEKSKLSEYRQQLAEELASEG